MAKTVFGMPGVGKKPEGESASADPTKAANPTASPTAKPAGAPMAKPMSAPLSAEKPAAGDGARTMFGMPAVKLPIQTANTEPPGPVAPEEKKEKLQPMYAETQAISAVGPRGASMPAGGETDDKLAFKETMLGMAAIRPDSVPPTSAPPPPSSTEPPKQDLGSTPALGMRAASATVSTPAAAPASTPSETPSVDGDSVAAPEKKKKKKAAAVVEPPPSPKSSAVGKAVLILLVVLAVAGIVYGIVTSSPTPAPTPDSTPSVLPGLLQQQGASGVPQGVPGVPQAPVPQPSVPPAPPAPAQ